LKKKISSLSDELEEKEKSLNEQTVKNEKLEKKITTLKTRIDELKGEKKVT